MAKAAARPNTTDNTETTLTRRAALAGAPAGVAAALGVATAVSASAVALRAAQGAEMADADLIEADRRLIALIERWHGSSAEVGRTFEIAKQSYPPQPEETRITRLDMALFGPRLKLGLDEFAAGGMWDYPSIGRLKDLKLTVAEIAGTFGPDTVFNSPVCDEMKCRADEIVSAHDTWRASCDQVAIDTGYRAANEVEDFDFEALRDLAYRIGEMTATTLAGLIAKARVAAFWLGDLDPAPSDREEPSSTGDAVARTIVRDLLTAEISTAHTPSLTAVG